MKRKWIFAIVLSLLFVCAGCAAEQQKTQTPADGEGVAPVLLRAGEAASAEIARSVDDLIDNPWHNAILLVEFVNPGEYTRVESSQTFVSPGLEDITITSCGAEALATVLEVYKGDSALVGQTITVGEALNQQEDGTFASGLLGSAELRRAIVFANKQDANYQFVCSTPEHEVMPVGEDGTVTVWPWLEGAETLENMQGFSAYCQQRLNAAVVQSAGQPDREEPTRPLNAEELAALETALNRPLNNYLVRSYYNYIPGD